MVTVKMGGGAKVILIKILKYLGVWSSIIRFRRHVYEYFGSDRFSRPALNQLDNKLQQFLNYENGFFIEVGANDGFSQSNTYYLERFKNWWGVLVEPIPELYEKCVEERPRSIVFNCALVSESYPDTRVEMLQSGLMSIVKGARKSERNDYEYVKRGLALQKDVDCIYKVSVPARTLTAILDEVGPNKIDFFALDVEGYELEVLRGLDFEKYRPVYMLIEANERDKIENLISLYYESIAELTDRDVLYRIKDREAS